MSKSSLTKSEFNSIPEKERAGRVLFGKAFYSFVHSPDMQSAERFNADPNYRTTLVLEDEAEVKKAKDWGLHVQEPTEDDVFTGPYVVIKRKVKAPKTADDVKIQVVDSRQNDIPSNILIGNGSEVFVKFGTYWYDNNGGGVNASLYRMQVRKLVPYLLAATDIPVEKGGFNLETDLDKLIEEASASSDEDSGEVDFAELETPEDFKETKADKKPKARNIFDD